MTVAQLIEWLKTQDQEATVEILKQETGRAYGGVIFSHVDFEPLEHSEYVDMRGNQFAKGKVYENDRTLFLGSEA